MTVKMVTAHLESGADASVEPDGSLILSISSSPNNQGPSSWTIIEIEGKNFCLSFWADHKYLEGETGIYLTPVTKEILEDLIRECRINTNIEGVISKGSQQEITWAAKTIRLEKLLREKYL